MHRVHHIEIVTQTLGNKFSPRAFEAVLAANLGQDRLKGQIHHPHYHFEDNCFAGGYAYMERKRELIQNSLAEGSPLPAWQAFGKLTHAAQDFYAHSNYVQLWLETLDGGSKASLTPEQIDALDPELLHSPRLASGLVYQPWELLPLIPGLGPLARLILPKDSHAWTNLDGPERGPLFAYAMAAARQRTLFEFEQISSLIREALGLEALEAFTDSR
jgi:hypothetical protein